MTLKAYIVSISLLLFCPHTVPVCAQPIPMIRYGIEQGLPSNNIYSVLTDSKGYLWIGTGKGLCRYDGSTFKLLTTQDGLPDNDVFACWEDPQHRYWIFTFKGTLCFIENGVVHTEANTPWLKRPPGSAACFSYPYIQKDGSLTLQDMEASGFYEIRDTTIKRFNASHLSPRWSIGLKLQLVGVRKEGPNRYYLYYPYYRLLADSAMNLISSAAAPRFYNVSKNIRYGIDKNIYDDLGHLLKKENIKGVPGVWSPLLFRINADQYWIAENTNLRLNRQIMLQGKTINTIERDTMGNFWFATKDGLYKISSHPLGIRNIPQAYTGKITYARTVAGMLLYTNNLNEIFRFLPDKPQKIVRFSSDTTWSDKVGNSNFITNDGTLFVLQDEFLYTGKALHPPYRRHRLFNHKNGFAMAKAILEEGNNLYIFSASCLFRLDKRTAAGQKAMTCEKIIDIPSDLQNRIYAKAVVPDLGQAWFSNTTGVYRVMRDTPELQKGFPAFAFRHFEAFGPYLAGITDDSKLILCNVSNPAYPWDSSSNDQCIWERIYPISHRQAIISTNGEYRLLSCYPPAASGKPRYTLQAVENPFLPLNAEYVTADSNTCYFFKNKTITAINTSLLFERAPPPIPQFTMLSTTRRTYIPGTLIALPYNESRNVTIGFDRISFTGNNTTCEYSISTSGSEEWFPVKGQEITLSAPGFGDYTVKLRAKTLSSGYSLPTVFRFSILKPFWATWWFLTICGALLLALVWLAILIISRIKIRRKQRQHDADMKYQQSEYKALNALMNPHFIFNSLNNIQGLINKDEKRVANEYLVIFSDLVRQNMHNVSKGFISLQQELNLVENYLTLEKLRFKDLIHYELLVDEEVDAEDIMIPPLMIQPLVENAVKHGLLPRQSTDSKVEIRVYEKENRLHIEITDNGIGITRSLESQQRLHESFGLSNLKKRTEHLRKIQQRAIDIEVTELKDRLGQATGTRALITIMLDNL